MSTASAAQVPKTKLEEQATAKADLSYSYWAKGELVSSTSTPAPKKLTDEEVAAQQQERERNSSGVGASAWNQAGTFEERCVTAWSKDRLKGLLAGLSKGAARILDLTSISGDANIWLVRGKKRCGFDFELTLTWQAEVGGKVIKGTLKIPNANPTDLDDLACAAETQVTHANGAGTAEQQQAAALAKQLLPLIEQAFEVYHMELKQK